MTAVLFFTLSSSAQVKLIKDWNLRNDIPVSTNPEIKTVQAFFYQDEEKVRLTFILPEKSGVKSVKCKFSFDPMYFFVLGKQVLINTKTKELKGIDYEFKNERYKTYSS